MKFARMPLDQARGGILAHSLKLADATLRKGRCLDEDTLAILAAASVESVVVAVLEDGDLGEDAAALQLGRALLTEGFRLSPVKTGRVNLIAESDGIVSIDAAAIDKANSMDEAVTLATLADLARVEVGQLAATVKIIPYGVPAVTVDKATDVLLGKPLKLHRFKGGIANLVLTKTPGFRDALLDKGEAVIGDRLRSLGYKLADVKRVDHDAQSVADALTPEADLTLILGASATADRRDVAPAGVVKAGGKIERFGMPVDPGNLLFLARLDNMPIVGLPGCARSPALNGADWVLERLSARLPITSRDIAAMGVGGLLKEMPDRPHSRLQT